MIRFQTIKKFILMLLIGLWLPHPCFAAATTVQHETTTHVQQNIHNKKTTKHSTHRSHSISRHKKKSLSKKSQRRRKNHHTTIPNDRTALVSTTTNVVEPPKPTRGLIASIGQRLVDFVHNTVSTLRYSAYKLGGTHFDTSRGVYVLDCSDYIDNILQTVYPDAYLDIVNSTGSEKPTTQHYYEFFNTLSTNAKDYWNKVQDVEQLQPGDILVFRYKSSLGGGGHVMVVMDKPVREDDAYFVRVADSAPVGHSEDTRPKRVSGIGIGTLLLKANRTGQPLAFAWKVGSRWESNVNIAMARPVNFYYSS